MKPIVIISGGSRNNSIIIDFIKKLSPTIIAVDSGVASCVDINIIPDIVVGDFDSVSTEYISNFPKWENKGTKIITLNPIKDDTDTEHAINYCLDNMKGDIYLFGAMGTRLDHSLSNINLLYRGIENNRNIEIIDSNNRIYLKNRSFTIKKDEQYGNYISLFPFNGLVEGLTLKGFFYSVDNLSLDGLSSLFISNEITEDYAQIDFKSGTLLVIESKD